MGLTFAEILDNNTCYCQAYKLGKAFVGGWENTEQKVPSNSAFYFWKAVESALSASLEASPLHLLKGGTLDSSIGWVQEGKKKNYKLPPGLVEIIFH